MEMEVKETGKRGNARRSLLSAGAEGRDQGLVEMFGRADWEMMVGFCNVTFDERES